MKPFRSRILPLAAAIVGGALPIAAFAQTTATTTPVGFVTVTVPAATSSTTPSSAPIAIPLYNSAAFQGTVSSVDSSSAFSLSGAAFTANQYSSSSAPYFVRMMSGTNVGRFFLITSNTTTQLTVNANGVNLTTLLTVGDSAQIVPANTLSSVFGATATGFQTGVDASSSDNVYLWNGTGWDLYYNNGTNWKKSGSLLSQNNVIVYPDEGLFISRRATTGPLTLTVLGTVPSTTEQSDLAGAGSSFVPNRFPVDTQLGSIGFQNSPNWTSGPAAGQADDVYIWNGTGWDVYYYNATNWKKSGSLLTQDTKVIPAGTAVFVTRVNSAPAFLAQSLPYTP